MKVSFTSEVVHTKDRKCTQENGAPRCTLATSTLLVNLDLAYPEADPVTMFCNLRVKIKREIFIR